MERAYRRTDYLDQTGDLMERWTNHFANIDTLGGPWMAHNRHPSGESRNTITDTAFLCGDGMAAGRYEDARIGSIKDYRAHWHLHRRRAL